jgi:hypothetical protein
MIDRWYRLARPGEPLTQGDMIFRCPILNWKSIPVEMDFSLGTGALSQVIDPFEDDVIIMTQACDLEHGKISNVVLCPHAALSDFKRLWEEDQRSRGQNPTAKSWQRLCDNIRDGYVWNLSMLNAEEIDGVKLEHRVVDFRDVFTIPREMLESLLRQRNEPRPQLLPPYREHLSQAFARFFMRVGLPTSVSTAW